MKHLKYQLTATGAEATTARVLFRFVIRAVLLSLFALFAADGFAKTLANLFVLTGLYCVVAAIIRREEPLGPALTHIDEAAAYAIGAGMVAWAS